MYVCSVYVIPCIIVIVVLGVVVGTSNLAILLGKIPVLFHTGTGAYTQVITQVVSAAEGNPRASRKDL